MEEILPQLIYGIYRSFHRVLYIPGGAGFLPSTVGTHRNPQSHRIRGYLAGICQQQQASRAMLKSMGPKNLLMQLKNRTLYNPILIQSKTIISYVYESYIYISEMDIFCFYIGDPMTFFRLTRVRFSSKAKVMQPQWLPEAPYGNG